MTIIFIALVVSFAVSYFLMPSLIRIAHKYHLLDRPDERKSHKFPTPTVGGVAIYFGFMLISMIISFVTGDELMGVILVSLSIMLLVGLRDDLDPMSPIEKLMGQLLAIGLLIFMADIRITQWYGLFGWDEMSYAVSIWISMLVYVFVINSFNLIDGIDGLCACLSMFVLLILGTWLYKVGQESFAYLAISVVGATAAFLKYNISPSRIFMGDTGSLVLGTVCTLCAIQTMELNESNLLSEYSFYSGPAIVIGLMALPIFDTLRVFVLRLMAGKSPLEPDRNHIHHLLIRSGLSHMQATGLLLICTTGFVLLGLEMQDYNLLVYFILFIFIASILTFGLHRLVMVKGKLIRSR